MDKLRLRFEKTGRAVYISHLDLMRVMQRAMLRAGVPIKYSEGFNPHALISICLPLSVGCASVCELMDFRVTADVDLAELPEALTAVMPEGIRALECYEQERKTAQLKWLRVKGVFDYDARDAREMAAALAEFFARKPITVMKRTKRGEGEFDLAQNISGVCVQALEDSVTIDAVISAQEPTVNPELLVSALRSNAPRLAPDFARFTRLETYDADMKIFR